MKLEQGLNEIDESAAADAAKGIEDEGYRVFHLPEGIVSRDAFFDAVRGLLPLAPPLASNYSWDALSDSLWGGLDELGDESMAIVWHGAEQLEQASSRDFEIARSILADVSDSLADADATQGQTKRVVVLLARAARRA